MQYLFKLNISRAIISPLLPGTSECHIYIVIRDPNIIVVVEWTCALYGFPVRGYRLCLAL